MYHLTTLHNGLRVLTVPMKGTSAVTVLVMCKVGSRYEYPAINGAAHFIEHMMFKGTKRRPRTLDISRALDGVGAEYNAFTGKDSTAYYIKADARHGVLAADLLHDMLFHSVYDPQELKRERGVIVEEINMYRDNPTMHIEELLETALFEGNTLGWEIGGSRETVQTMTRAAMIAFRDEYYVPANMTVCLAGAIRSETTIAIKQRFGQVAGGVQTPRLFCPMASASVVRRPRAQVQFKKTEQMQLAFGFRSYPVDDPRNTAVELLSVVLGGTMSSRLFVSVRERRGLAYIVRAQNSHYEDTGAFLVQAGLDRARLALATKVILQEIRKIKKQGVTARELREAKDHVCGGMLLKMENSFAQAQWYANALMFLPQVKTPAIHAAEIQKVTRAQVHKAANDILDERKMCASAIGPYHDARAFLQASGL